MKISELLLLSVSLAMDAFSVSLCKGMKTKGSVLGSAAVIAAFFGIAQAVMPLAGWLLSHRLIKYIEKFVTDIAADKPVHDLRPFHVAFGILAVIGIKMIADALKGGDDNISDKQDLRELTLLAIATSLDALAVGVTLAIDPQTNIFVSAAVIGAVTFLLCFAGVPTGRFFGDKLGKPAAVAGGCVLILTGLKIMLEGIGVL